MRRLLLLFSLVSLSAPAAAQSYRYMGWGDSLHDPDTDLAVDCSALPATSTLVVSFEAPVGDLTGVSGYLDFCTRPYTLPEWWQFNLVGGCREGAYSVTADFSSGPSTHLDPWASGAMVDFSLEYPFGGPAMGRIWFDISTADGMPVPLQVGEEYYACKFVFDNPSVGCGDCEIPACFVLNGLVLHHSSGVAFTSMDFSNWAQWRGGTVDCPFVVPILGTSWGSVKAVYR